MGNIEHRAARARVSPRGKCWTEERWFLEIMEQGLLLRRDTVQYRARRDGYSVNNVWQLLKAWCVTKYKQGPWSQDYPTVYALNRAGLRRLIDLRNLEQQEKES